MATRQLAPLLIKPPSRLATLFPLLLILSLALPPPPPPPCLVIVLNLAPNVYPLGWNPRTKKKKEEGKNRKVIKGDGFTRAWLTFITS